MRLRRGGTLVEMMIVAAILGIVGASGADGVVQLNRHSSHLLQRERALQVLEYEAAGVVSGRPVKPEATALLLRELPGAKLESRSSAGVRVIRVTWDSPRGVASRELVVLETRP